MNAQPSSRMSCDTTGVDQPSLSAMPRKPASTQQARTPLGRLAVLLAVISLSAACSAGPVGVNRLSPGAAYKKQAENVLATGKVSDDTRNTLRRHDLLTQFEADPAAAIAVLRLTAFSGNPKQRELAALAETSFAHALDTHDRQHFLAAALYSYAFLFGDSSDEELHPLDPRVQLNVDIYNAAIARAFISESGRSVDLKGGTYDLPFGTIDIAFESDSLIWGNGRLVDFIPANELEVVGLRNHYRRAGIGAPLAGTTMADESVGASEEHTYMSPIVRTPVTAVLRMENTREQLAGSALSGTLEVYTPTDPEDVKIGRYNLPLEAEPTATLAVALAEKRPWAGELTRFLGGAIPGSAATVRLSALHPSRENRIPVIFVHGTYSSSSRWANMVNDLNSDKLIRDRFDFYFFSYDSGNPILYSGNQLRTKLNGLYADLSEKHPNNCIDNMIVMGHSQGGLLTRLMATDSGTKIWDEMSDKPFDPSKISEKNRDLITNSLFFEARPYVDRVIFIATPHRGSYMASSGFVKRMASRLISLPSDLASASADILQLREDPDVMLNMERMSTSIDNMSPGSRAVKVMSKIPVSEDIHAHSIIAVKNDGPLEDGVDGVVAYKSAHIEGVDSEFIVRSGHSCQDNPNTINEVRRILELQAATIQCGETTAP